MEFDLDITKKLLAEAGVGEIEREAQAILTSTILHGEMSPKEGREKLVRFVALFKEAVAKIPDDPDTYIRPGTTRDDIMVRTAPLMVPWALAVSLAQTGVTMAAFVQNMHLHKTEAECEL